jgi:aspartate--ammonia ligase
MNRGLQLPAGYRSILNLKETEHAIKKVKDSFQISLASELRLRRVTAPIFVLKGTGINDDLNGVERPVSFPVKSMNEQVAEVVHSLAKWKRMKLADYDIEMGYGIYTDMNALRPDEEMSNMHSLYVDQWDWERVISENQRNLNFLKEVVVRIYQSFKRTEFLIYESYPELIPSLPDEIKFIHAQELLDMYPDLAPKDREDKIAEKYGAVFIVGIGGKLSNGESHDGRAPDYDDWTTPNEEGHMGLNGDIILWNPILECAFEISSMGIRVNKDALLRQLALTGTEERKELLFHKRLLNNELPLSIGGGIGQSRLCMYLLKKAHIGEIQASIWPPEMVDECVKNNIFLV